MAVYYFVIIGLMAKLVSFSLFGILIFHFLSSFYRWYDQIWWLDIPMHLIGGMWVALLFVYLFEKNVLKLEQIHFFKALILCLGFVALVGIFWEFYEYLSDVYIYNVHPLNLVFNPKNYPDTLSDLVNDFIGGIVALCSIYFIKKTKKALPKTTVNPLSG